MQSGWRICCRYALRRDINAVRVCVLVFHFKLMDGNNAAQSMSSSSGLCVLNAVGRDVFDTTGFFKSDLAASGVRTKDGLRGRGVSAPGADGSRNANMRSSNSVVGAGSSSVRSRLCVDDANTASARMGSARGGSGRQDAVLFTHRVVDGNARPAPSGTAVARHAPDKLSTCTNA